MLRFVLRRILQMIPTIIAVSLLIFVIFSVVPGSIASSMIADGRGTNDPRMVEKINEEFGLDKPLYVRFGEYMLNLAQFDLGTSFRTRQPVAEMIGERLFPTLKLAFAAMIIAIVLGLPLGFVAALKPGSLLDSLTMVGAISGLSLPQFWLGLLLMYFFALTLGWLPSFGYGDGGLRNLILPALTLGVAPLALLARTTRAAVLEVMNADFIRTARSKGMNSFRLVKWHVVRNALVLVITTLGLQFGSMMGQAVVVEKLFSWPGLGSLLVDSVALRDIPVVQGSILILVLCFLVVNTLVDVLYGVIDPRISHG
ncbi:ABC transporter permease [Nitratireductor aquimarinus]|uniref:ABC transporter permease n=1 Tax=Nitratireductor TaxID=245876 RepID=UPI000DDC89D3|nr:MULTISPECIES: ABC transporter permease [Nitratireductor]MBN7776568.1 ABC transporter permease [Nitratireductor pacificus]MBN7779435.1 ABC transporter permease [Nitratireductor pacificus]MBN7788242.1 ABC transporter permease [Nitratireductor aquimarinus]MBY6098289.1 ABC transporter permease [Nitratireductor aquimarinus]MCA1259268.1 ABC transporter permease [Nitratireductor aquimarinus]